MLQKPTTQLLHAASQLWKLESPLKYLQFSESFVYESICRGIPIICRVMPASHRSFEEVLSELDWVYYLSSKGLSVATPLSSCKNSFVENLKINGNFHVSVFAKAKGQSLEKPEDFTLSFFKKWGQFLGKMHKLTKHYQPKAPIESRRQWQDSPTLQIGRLGLDTKDRIPHDQFIEFHKWLNTLETNQDCFGLVHADLHTRNFFVDDGKITAFDFDDSCYHWFSYDLAIPLFNIIRTLEDPKSKVSYNNAFYEYMDGYSLENKLDQKWIDRIELFVQFRICNVYHWIKGRQVEGTLSDSQKIGSADFMRWSAEQMQTKPLKLF